MWKFSKQEKSFLPLPILERPKEHWYPSLKGFSVNPNDLEAYNKWKSGIIPVPEEYLDAFIDGQEIDLDASDKNIDFASIASHSCTTPTQIEHKSNSMNKIKTALDIDNKKIVYDGCMVTYSGIIINLYAPKSNDYLLEDIAHGLAFNCRWNGATKTYFSVAEHCCMMYDKAPDELKGYALFHDSEEAYWGDIIKPLKNLLPDATRRLMRDMRYVIISNFLGERTPASPKIIDELDFEMLQWDFDNMILKSNHVGMDCYKAEQEWLKRANQLLNVEQNVDECDATESQSGHELLANNNLEEDVVSERWMSVKEDGYPKYNVGVLVFIPEEDFHITSGMWDISNKWVLLDEYRVPDCEITHWMKLPDIPSAYKKEQKENDEIMCFLSKHKDVSSNPTTGKDIDLLKK